MTDLNDKQKKVILAAGAVPLLMLLFPPYQVLYGPNHIIQDTSYAFILDLPFRASLSGFTLITQWIGVILIGTVGVFYFQDGARRLPESK